MSASTASGWSIELCRDRVERAGEIRDQMIQDWSQFIGAKERPQQFGLMRGQVDGSWAFVLNTLIPMPVRLSTLFGEWLYLLRAALDGLVYYLAVRDSGQNPPPAERSIYFPVSLDATKYDSPDYRGKLQALSDPTYALLRTVQPFNALPDHRSNVLWWLEELARVDRHRRGHALAPHIINARIGLAEPLKLTINHLLDPPRPVPVDESGPMPILELEAPKDWGEREIRQHMDIGEALTSKIDVTEWAIGATSPMASVNLGERMIVCERFVLDGIVNPLVTEC